MATPLRRKSDMVDKRGCQNYDVVCGLDVSYTCMIRGYSVVLQGLGCHSINYALTRYTHTLARLGEFLVALRKDRCEPAPFVQHYP